MEVAIAQPAWITVLAALLTPTIALIALYIAWQQWKTNRNKLKLDLFDRRFAVYDATRTLIGQLLSGSHATDRQIFEFTSRTRETAFLLDQGIADYLWKEIYRNACELAVLHSELEGVPVGEERTRNIARQTEIRNWFDEQLEVLNKKFDPYLKLEH